MSKKYVFTILFVLLIICAEYYDVSLPDLLHTQNWVDDLEDAQMTQADEKKEEVVYVSRVVDGDTLDLNTGERVRLIGIDTPERGKAFYEDATQHLSSLVLDKEVILVKDISEKDRYGRLLRHVYVRDLWINKTMIEDGFARLVTYPPDVMHVDLFYVAEKNAREKKKGIWSINEDDVYEKK